MFSDVGAILSKAVPLAASVGIATYAADIPKLSPVTAGAVAFLLYATKRIDDKLRAVDMRIDKLAHWLGAPPPPPPDKLLKKP